MFLFQVAPFFAQQLAWLDSNQDPGRESVLPRCMAATSQNEIYMGGNMEAQVHLGNSLPLSSSYRRTVFFGKYDSQGNARWGNLLKSTHGVSMRRLVSQPTPQGDGVLVAGEYNQHLLAEGQQNGMGPGVTVLSNPGLLGTYILHCDPQGSIRWVHNFPHSANNHLFIEDLAVDKTDGSYYAMGTFIGTLDFDPHPGEEFLATSFFDFSHNRRQESGFIAKFSRSGAFQWVRVLGHGGRMAVHQGVVIREAGQARVVCLLDYSRDVQLDASTQLVHPGVNSLLVQYDGQGNLIRWLNQPMLGFTGTFQHLVSDDLGNLYLGGGIGNSIGGIDHTFSKFDPQLNLKWTGRGPRYISTIYDMTLDSQNRIAYCGTFSNHSTSTLDPGNKYLMGVYEGGLGFYTYSYTYRVNGAAAFPSQFSYLIGKAIVSGPNWLAVGGLKVGDIDFDLRNQSTGLGIAASSQSEDFFLAKYYTSHQVIFNLSEASAARNLYNFSWGSFPEK